MTEQDKTPWFRTPSHQVFQIEKNLRKLREGADEYAAGTAEMMMMLILPELRTALQEAGIELVECGPSDSACCACQGAAITVADFSETALYRWWDDADRLLYIGISDNLGARTKGHAKRSSWMIFALRSTVERHPSRLAAERAEEAAIRAECPLFNFQHNSSREARRRAVEYLIERDRFDLLIPAISRG